MLDGLSVDSYPRSEWERSHAMGRPPSPRSSHSPPHIGGHRDRPAPVSAHRIAPKAIPTPVEQAAVPRPDGRRRPGPRRRLTGLDTADRARRDRAAGGTPGSGPDQRPHRQPGNLVSWRWLATDPNDVAFNVYRGRHPGSTPSPLTTSTNYLGRGAPAQADYTVRAVVNGVEQAPSRAHALTSSTPGTRTCRSPRRPEGARHRRQLAVHLRGQRRLRRRPRRRRHPWTSF